MNFVINTKLVQDWSLVLFLPVNRIKFPWYIKLLLITDCKFLSLANSEYFRWPLGILEEIWK